MDPMAKDESKKSLPNPTTDSFGAGFRSGPRTAEKEIQLHPLGSSLPRGSFQGNQRLQRQEKVNPWKSKTIKIIVPNLGWLQFPTKTIVFGENLLF